MGIPQFLLAMFAIVIGTCGVEAAVPFSVSANPVVGEPAPTGVYLSAAADHLNTVKVSLRALQVLTHCQ